MKKLDKSENTSWDIKIIHEFQQPNVQKCLDNIDTTKMDRKYCENT